MFLIIYLSHVWDASDQNQGTWSVASFYCFGRVGQLVLSYNMNKNIYCQYIALVPHDFTYNHPDFLLVTNILKSLES